jgi:predicted amidohydrolase
VPLAYYGSRLGRYASDDKKKEIEKIAKAALDVVSSSPNPVLVLPELFLPASCADEVGQYARDRKTALIAGVEYLESIEGPINQALISLPHLFVNVMQVKTRSSPDEVRFAYESSGVYILGGTDIGSFAVVVCSDFREFDLLAAIANAPFLIDTLFVCSYNSKPELFESFAISDAARLYCHVVIGNGCWDVNSPNTGSSRGSTVCSPLADPAKQKLAPSRVVPLALPPVGGVSPAIALFELRIGELRSDKDKPTGGYLNAPYFRRPIPYPIARA